MYNKKLMAVSLAVLLSLMFSLIFPAGVLADDGQPPAPEVTNPAEGNTEDVNVPEALDTEEPDLEDGTEATDSDVPELLDTEGPALEEGTETTDSDTPDAASDETSDEAESPAAEEPLLSQLPEGTEVVVLDEEGQVLPLGSQEADAAIISGDPMWCPDGVDPVAGVGGCSSGYTSMTALLAALAGANQPTQNGTIWIEKTYNSSTAEPGGTTLITIDGNTFTTWRNYSLTIQGGWDGSGTNTYSGASIFSGDRLWIDNWLNNITVRNILVSNANGDQGLRIDNDGATARNVTVENVTVTGTTSANGYGLYIDTNEHNGTVTVRNSTFTSNGNDGLYIEAMGGVTLQDIISTGNVNEGAQVINTDSTTRSPVQVLGTNIFSNNTGYGLLITTDGAVALNNITADNSTTQDGVNINNDQGNADGTSTVTLTGTNYFRNNGNDGNDDGLIITSRGAVSLTNVTATGNRDEGMEINNTLSSTRASVTIGGTNVFNANSGNGLVISSDGAISLNNVTANDSINDSGAVLNNNQSGANSSSSVTITGNNSFSGNDEYGLEIDSMGAVTLQNIIANANERQYGANINNDVTGASAAVSSVTITGNNSFSDNDDYGLEIDSRGAVSLENITADDNDTQYGVNVDNVSNAVGNVSSVTISGTNSFSKNNEYGLEIDSIGAVSLENITTSDNTTGDGVNIDNGGGTGSVTLAGTQTFTNNGNGDGDDGLYIRSQGNVSLAGVIATGNKDEGVEIDNTPGTASATVQIGGTNVFSNNVGTGLFIYSEGNVGLNNVTANTNTNGNGLYIENYNSATNGTVTLTGTNNFNGNRNSGLYVRSKGAITLSDVTANNSVVDNGVILDNDETGAVGGVTITGANNVFSGNNDYGLGIYSRGAVSLENITASSNKLEDGVYIDNGNGTGSVTLTGTLTFTNNGDNNSDDGLYIRTRSSVTLENVSATLNKDDGVEIDNTPGTGGGVTVTGSTFDQNLGDGLYVRSKGLITLVDVTANQNGNKGGDISNDVGGSVAGANVFVIRSTFNSNGNDGLFATSNLDVILINVIAQNNDNDGVELFSDGDNVVLCGGVFSGNNAGGGTADYNVRASGATRTRSSDIVVTNWTPTAGWTTIANGTGRCNYPDADTDLLPNDWDADDDNDTILDGIDACPIGAAVGTDTDGDGCKDTTEDTDNDNDGVLNAGDSCSIGASTGTDTDGDGCKDDTEDADDDNDGVLDVNDAFPLDPTESTDTDGDGTGNNADTDDDNDGVLDVDDVFPLNPGESTDADGDGIGDNADPDDDNDGISDLMEIHLAKVEERKPEGSTLFNPSLLIPVTGAVTLSCTELLTALEMAGFEVAFDSLCGYEAGLGEITESELPGALPAGSKFIGGVGIVLLQNGSLVNVMPTDTNITLSFDVPSGLTAETLAVLYWDSAASAWVEKSVKVTDGKVILTDAVPGTFVLVGK